MNIKVDENLPNSVASILKDAGHDASTVHDEALQGAKDAELIKAVQSEERALLTLDTGFADIRAYRPEDHRGLIVLRLHRQDKVHVDSVVARIAPELREDEVAGRLWIVEENRIRIRE